MDNFEWKDGDEFCDFIYKGGKFHHNLARIDCRDWRVLTTFYHGHTLNDDCMDYKTDQYSISDVKREVEKQVFLYFSTVYHLFMCEYRFRTDKIG